jgi:hypothetical protein
MKLNREQNDSSIKYIEDVLENWEQWQTHHSKLTKAMKDLISFAKELTIDIERLRAEVSVKRKLLDKCVDLEDKIKADTVRKMRDRFSSLLSEEYRKYTPEGADQYFKNGAYMMRAIADRLIIVIAKEMLEDNNND